jgi:cytochrome c peroxidase
MKHKLFIITLSGILGVFVIIQSCMKDPELRDSEENNALKALKDRTGALNDMEQLGKLIFFDNISSPNNMSCASCHKPEYGFTGPNSGQNLKSGIYHGAVATRWGNRKPPSSAYATFSPVFHYSAEEHGFVGGNFWDGRATGFRLGNPAADQALGPFLNPVEQNHPDAVSVLKQIAASKYMDLWVKVWDEPISTGTPEKEKINYDRVGLSIAAYEASKEVNQFSSKYDYYLKGAVQLDPEELKGLQLFNGKAKCGSCHTSITENGNPGPLFTAFDFYNLGVPKNPDNPFYRMNTVYLDNGEPINPLGPAWIDFGLGAFLLESSNPEWQAMAAENMGKHRIPTLRNVDKRPGPGNVKAYMHNGVFKSLEDVVHFYNTRDSKPWPAPEVNSNIENEFTGNLLLTKDEEKAIVAFMKTLSDGYVVKNRN